MVDGGAHSLCGFIWVTWYDTFWGSYSKFRIESDLYAAEVSGNQYSCIIGPYLGENTQFNGVLVKTVDVNGNESTGAHGPVFRGADPKYSPLAPESLGLDDNPPGTSPTPGSSPHPGNPGSSGSSGNPPSTGGSGPGNQQNTNSPAPWNANPTGSKARVKAPINPGPNYENAPTEYREIVNGTPGSWKSIYYPGSNTGPWDFYVDVPGLTAGKDNTLQLELRNDNGTSKTPELTVTTPANYWISGTVVDDTGAPVFNAPIEIENEEGESVTVYTDVNGDYEVEAPDGPYKIVETVPLVVGIEDVR